MACCGFRRTVETITSSTGVGTIPDGLYSYTVTNVGGSPGVLGGVTFPAAASVTFQAYFDETFRRLSGMTYNASGTTFLITTTP